MYAGTDLDKPPRPQNRPINLVIAVSFGLLIPPRILGLAKYGGLNVHPSMLPEYEEKCTLSTLYPLTDIESFHGPAPLHHTLLSGTDLTGITVQTLHPRHFDQGKILLQTPQPGIPHKCRNVEQLSEKLAPEGANLLMDCLKNRLYLDDSSCRDSSRCSDTSNITRTLKTRHAPKVTKADRFINWTTWSAEEILLKQRTIGPLWSSTKMDAHIHNEKRVIWSTGFERTVCRPDIDLPVGQPVVTNSHSQSPDVYVRTCDNQVLKVGPIKIEGHGEAEAFHAVKQARMQDPNPVKADGPLFRTQISSTLPDHYQFRTN